MSLRTVMMGPGTEMGYAVFFEHPTDGSPVVNVMTKTYIMRVLPIGNVMLAQQLKDKGVLPYDVSIHRTPEQIAQFTHDCFLKLGYKDRQPHTIEQVDMLYDFNDKEFQKTNDVQKAIVEIRKHYNLHGGGTFLFPSYPEMMPTGFLPPPVPFIPFPSSPI